MNEFYKNLKHPVDINLPAFIKTHYDEKRCSWHVGFFDSNLNTYTACFHAVSDVSGEEKGWQCESISVNEHEIGVFISVGGGNDFNEAESKFLEWTVEQKVLSIFASVLEKDKGIFEVLNLKSI
jgi:hypothetical protein